MFESANEFSFHIEMLAQQKNAGIVDTLTEYCTENFIEPEDIAKLINKSLRDKLEMDFIDQNYLPKQATLDI